MIVVSVLRMNGIHCNHILSMSFMKNTYDHICTPSGFPSLPDTMKCTKSSENLIIHVFAIPARDLTISVEVDIDESNAVLHSDLQEGNLEIAENSDGRTAHQGDIFHLSPEPHVTKAHANTGSLETMSGEPSWSYP